MKIVELHFCLLKHTCFAEKVEGVDKKWYCEHKTWECENPAIIKLCPQTCGKYSKESGIMISNNH